MMNRKPIYAIAALILATLACATVTVTNLSQDHNVVIDVTLPDDAYGTIKLGPGESIDYMATTGGPYKVEVLPSEDYLASLQKRRDHIVSVLALNPLLPLDPYGGGAVFTELTSLQTEIDNLPRTEGTDCSGSIPNDAPDGYTISVNVSFDTSAGEWSCTATAGPG